MYARFFNAPDGSTPPSQLAKLDTNKIKSYSYTAKFAGAGEFTLLLHFSLLEMGSNLAVKVRYTLGSRKC